MGRRIELCLVGIPNDAPCPYWGIFLQLSLWNRSHDPAGDRVTIDQSQAVSRAGQLRVSESRLGPLARTLTRGTTPYGFLPIKGGPVLQCQGQTEAFQAWGSSPKKGRSLEAPGSGKVVPKLGGTLQDRRHLRAESLPVRDPRRDGHPTDLEYRQSEVVLPVNSVSPQPEYKFSFKASKSRISTLRLWVGARPGYRLWRPDLSLTFPWGLTARLPNDASGA